MKAKVLIAGLMLAISSSVFAADMSINPVNFGIKDIPKDSIPKDMPADTSKLAVPQTTELKKAVSNNSEIAQKVKIDVSKIAKKDTPPAEKAAAKDELIGMGKQAQPYIEKAKAASQDKEVQKQLQDVLSKIKKK